MSQQRPAQPSPIAVCLKWVNLRPEIDPLTAEIVDDPRWYGLSPADEAALETALVLAERWDTSVVAFTAGGEEADRALRSALACGAKRAVRVPMAAGASSDRVAHGLAGSVRVEGSLTVLCGDHSLDRGSGSVPAFLAHELSAAQALGLVDVSSPRVAHLEGVRRLDGGRRECLSVSGPAVVSVEGNVARLRRASLALVIAADAATIECSGADETDHTSAHDVGHGAGHAGSAAIVRPYRPRARALPGPVGGHSLERIRTLIGAGVERVPPRRVEVPAPQAADIILEQLRAWGYLDR